MPTMTMKEWAEEYRRINEWEQQERMARLPAQSVEESIRAYFGLCAMLLPLARAAEQNADLWELRLKHYEALAEKWRRLARRTQHAA